MKLLTTTILLALGCVFISACQDETNMTQPEGNSIYSSQNGQAASDAHPAIAYTASVTTKGKTYATVAVMDSDGTDQTNIYTASTTTTGINVRPSWSPDGGSIAFISHEPNNSTPYTIYLRDVSLSNGKPVGSNTRSIYTASSGTFVRHLSWCSTSSTAEVAFVTGGTGSNTVQQLQVVSTSGGTPTVLYVSNADDNKLYYSPTWSSDDSKIAFIEHTGSSSTSNPDTIRVVDASNGTLLESIAVGSVTGITFLEWSRSGLDKLALTPNFGSGNVLYYVTPTSGSSLTTNSVSGVSPSWSPNNSSVVTWNGSNALRKTVYGSSSTSTVVTGAGYYGTWKR